MKQTQTAQITQKIDQVSLPRTIHLVPLNNIAGFDVRPGFYEINGATAIPGGVNFTVHSKGAVSVSLASCSLYALTSCGSLCCFLSIKH